MARGKIKTMSDEIIPAAPKLLGRESDFDKILLHLQGNLNAVLSDNLKAYLERLSQTADWLRMYGSMYKVRKMIKNHFKVSDSTAIKYCNEAQLAFGGTSLQNQNFNIDSLLADIMKDTELSRAKKDFRAVKGFHQLRKDIIKDFFGGSEADFYRRLNEEKTTIVIGFYPELVKHDDVPDDPQELEAKLKKYKSSRRQANLDEFIEDAEYSDLPKENGFDNE